MAKRIYTPKPVSPEIARENAIKVAMARVHYAKRDVTGVTDTVAQWVRRGITEVDGLTLADLDRRLAHAAEELAHAQAELTALVG